MLLKRLNYSNQIAATVLAVVLLAGWIAPALAQSPITARTDRSTIAADEQLILTVTVTGDFLAIPRPDLSALEDFVVVNSSTSTQVSIVNGKMTSQGVYIYRLQPLGEGLLDIAPVSVNIDGQLYETDPLEIEVLPAGTQTQQPDTPDSTSPPNTTGRDFFVEAEVNNSNPYLGEQIIYTFRFYQGINFFGQPDYRPPSFTDFWSRQIINQPQYNTDVDGRKYAVSEIRTALFPANLGELTIDPARLVIPGGMFEPDVKLEANPVTVNVKPLPDNAPPNFSGAVGQFEIQTSLSDLETKVNEPLTLVVEITGVGNIETVTEPALPELSGWRYFDSSADTHIDSRTEVLSGARTFERLIVPGESGEQLFPAVEFSFYNPTTDQYETAASDPMLVNVLPDDSAQDLPLITGFNSDQQAPELLASDIEHIKPVPFSLNTPQVVSAFGRVLYWSAWIVPLFAIGGALVWKRQQLRLERDPAYARSISARKRALNILGDAQTSGSDVSGAAGRSLLGYLADKLNTPTAGLTTSELLKVLHKNGLDHELVSRTKSVLDQVDIGRFAPISAGDEKALISETRLLINDLEKAFG